MRKIKAMASMYKCICVELNIGIIYTDAYAYNEGSVEYIHTHMRTRKARASIYIQICEQCRHRRVSNAPTSMCICICIQRRLGRVCIHAYAYSEGSYEYAYTNMSTMQTRVSIYIRISI